LAYCFLRNNCPEQYHGKDHHDTFLKKCLSHKKSVFAPFGALMNEKTKSFFPHWCLLASQRLFSQNR
jgi:hypothetical protein